MEIQRIRESMSAHQHDLAEDLLLNRFGPTTMLAIGPDEELRIYKDVLAGWPDNAAGS